MDSGRIWKQIDKRIDGGVSNLRDDDICYYCMDRISGGYSASDANQKIANLKIRPSEIERNPHRKRHKDSAVSQFAEDLISLLAEPLRTGYIKIALVPMCPSKPRNNPDYDNRLMDVSRLLQERYPDLLIADLLSLTRELPSSLSGGVRNPEMIKEALAVSSFDKSIDPRIVIVLDDVITSGAHFVAAKDSLKELFPNSAIVGVFWAKQRPKGSSATQE